MSKIDSYRRYLDIKLENNDISIINTIMSYITFECDNCDDTCLTCEMVEDVDCDCGEIEGGVICECCESHQCSNCYIFLCEDCDSYTCDGCDEVYCDDCRCDRLYLCDVCGECYCCIKVSRLELGGDIYCVCMKCFDGNNMVC